MYIGRPSILTRACCLPRCCLSCFCYCRLPSPSFVTEHCLDCCCCCCCCMPYPQHCHRLCQLLLCLAFICPTPPLLRLPPLLFSLSTVGSLLYPLLQPFALCGCICCCILQLLYLLLSHCQLCRCNCLLCCFCSPCHLSPMPALTRHPATYSTVPADAAQTPRNHCSFFRVCS